jgi:hypothetical protein
MLPLPDTMEDKIPVHADPSRIVKFDSQSNSKYQSALNKLKEFERNALRAIATRFGRYIGELPLRFRHPQLTKAASVDNKAYLWPTLKPSSTVPFVKDGDFVGCADIMAGVGARLSNAAALGRVAFVGLGGIG